MIQANNLSKSYGRQVLFEEVGFTINPGERVGLVGRNGHGKTTLVKMIIGEEHPDSGNISIPNNYIVGHLSQHLGFSADTVLGEGCLGLRKGEDGRDESYRVKTVLHGLGFTTEDFDRRPAELSGGFQVRLSLAKVLLGEPDLLLLDEPTNYLDILSVRWLREFLRNWRHEMIIITHDREFMDSVTTHTMGIHRYKIRKIAGGTDKLYSQLLMEEEMYERTRINDEKRRSEVERFINRFRAQATKARAVQSKIKLLQKKERLQQLDAVRTLDFEFPYAPFEGKWLMTINDLVFSYSAAPPLIDGLSMAIGPGDRIAIVGKNGKGKTTLLNLLAGELRPLSGEIVVNQKTIPAYFGQMNIERLDPSKTVEQEILDVHPDDSRKAARAICGIMMFEGDDALKKVSVLSGGEKSRALLGKMLVCPSNLLMLDEPTNHLDMESVDSLIEALDAFEGAVVIVTHSEMILKSLATRLVVFDDDKVSLFEGTYEDFLQRVGWKSEEPVSEADNNSGNNRRAATVDRKEARRLRAELITGRGRVLNVLQKDIDAAENEIMELEKRIEKDTAALVEASEKGDWQPIAELSKSTHEARQRIEELFAKLETLTSEHVAQSKLFDERLAQLSQE
jgi:ATP-binding cassette, subfamily F, member 3